MTTQCKIQIEETLEFMELWLVVLNIHVQPRQFTLTQQRLFVLLGSEGPLLFICKVNGGLCVVCGCNTDALFCSPCVDTVRRSDKCLQTPAIPDAHFCPPKFLPIIFASSEFFRHTGPFKVNMHFGRKYKHKTDVNKDSGVR